jgi:DNA repair protein RecO
MSINERHFTTEAIILKCTTSGEINRLFTFISPIYGVTIATAYGAEKIKSRFCPVIQNLVQANLFLDKNPKTGYLKCSDISDVETNDFLRANLDFIYIMSFFSDIILNTPISYEEYKSFYYLLKYSIEILKDKKDVKKAFLFFTAKYFFLSGYNFNLKVCKKCNGVFDGYYFDAGEKEIYCPDCASSKNHPVSSAACFLWDKYLENKFVTLKEESSDDKSFYELYPITLDLLKHIFDRELKTYQSIKLVFFK